MKAFEKAIVGLILIIGLSLLLINNPEDAHENYMTINIDGTVVEKAKISEHLNETITIEIEGDIDAKIEVDKKGRVRVLPMPKDACPLGICSHTGWISKPGEAIVCMPNKMIVKIE
ncbi:NusG domain II-containing protein [Desulfitibacter alkalitolerans]|uniref:NusG domain II-containing protein n=1 Tax=Desulfitibacter alkalitolerans TaxID=264641 RepID=UPI0004857220|nr:NusG domain II-containing protein [Desulfitibacter alkalitolerans]